MTIKLPAEINLSHDALYEEYFCMYGRQSPCNKLELDLIVKEITDNLRDYVGLDKDEEFFTDVIYDDIVDMMHDRVGQPVRRSEAKNYFELPWIAKEEA